MADQISNFKVEFIEQSIFRMDEYHTGQIAFRTKMIRDIDLGFYSDLELNTNNLPDYFFCRFVT